MALIRGLNSAISGIQTQQTKIDTIADNLANVTTNGFKQTRTLFSDLFSQTLSFGTAPQGNLGGVNPNQVGLGAKVGQQQHLFTQGPLKATGVKTDVAIEGDGFFVFNDQNGGQVFTRDGAFDLNAEQLVVNGSNGFKLQGFQANFDTFVVNTGVLTDLNIPVGNLSIARATTEVDFEGNLNGGGDTAIEGSILESDTLEDVNGGTAATLATLLTDLGRDDPAGGGTIDLLLNNGDVLEFVATKGGRQISRNFTIGSPPPFGGATVGDLVNFIEGFFAIHTGSLAGAEQHSAQLRDLTDGSVVSDQIDNIGGVDTAVVAGAGTEVGTNSITLTDNDVDFVASGVQVGDFIRFNSGPAAATIGRITAINVGGNPNALSFDQEVANATPQLGDTYSIHEPAGVRLGAAVVADANEETTRSVAGRLRSSANVGTLNAIGNVSLKSGGVKLFSFNETVAAVGESAITRSVVFDSLGNPRTVDYTFVLLGKSDIGNTFRFFADSDDNSNNPGVDFTRQVGSGTVMFGVNGEFMQQTTNTVNIDLAATGADSPLTFTADFAELSAFASSVDGNGNIINSSEVQVATQDGFEQGTLVDFAVGVDGTVGGIFDNGETRTIGQIVLGRFNNNEGLLDVGDNFFRAGVNSGDVAIGGPGLFGRGVVRGGFLEESNVELSEQFTELVVSQRAFQANARTISVANELLQEVVNIV